MRTTILSQPFASDGSPQTLGRTLASKLESGAYVSLKFGVAFATSSGTSRLYGPIREFISAGGRVAAYIGISNEITSFQAIEHLLSAGVEVWGFETGGNILFHPKVYFFSNETRAWLAVGSSNLTSHGLYRNFEVNSLTELDLGTTRDKEAATAADSWFSGLRTQDPHCFQMADSTLPILIREGRLVDEVVKPEIERVDIGRRSGPKARPRITIKVPGAPPPHPSLRGARTRTVRPRPRRATPRPVPDLDAAETQYFAMTLSAFDCSHRSGVPGTPEVSIPEDVADFFPSVSLQGRSYPDSYFDVILNGPGGATKIVSYRIWQRPPGSAVGHADWRINVKHETIDLTDPAGRDILLIERLPSGSNPPYEAWVIGTSMPEYQPLLERCHREVEARGKAGTKNYGLF